MFWVCQTTGIYDPTAKRFRKKNPFALKGISDIIILVSVLGFSFPIFLEVKSKKGVQKDDQKSFQQQVEKTGAYYFIVRSVDEACAAIGYAKEEIKRKLEALCREPS